MSLLRPPRRDTRLRRLHPRRPHPGAISPPLAFYADGCYVSLRGLVFERWRTNWSTAVSPGIGAYSGCGESGRLCARGSVVRRAERRVRTSSLASCGQNGSAARLCALYFRRASRMTMKTIRLVDQAAAG
jgi:hypothetical protein